MTKPITPIIKACTHCGDPCPERTQPTEEGHHFCCEGCRTVHAILENHQLEDFYRLDQRAGQSQRDRKAGDYAWLDIDKLRERFVRFRDADRVSVELDLPAIHCVSCVWLLERLPSLLPGVQQCEVDYGRRKASITFNERQVSMRRLAEMLDRIGYPPNLSPSEEKEAGFSNRRLITQIGVAGFCFGNVMLLSFPEYLGIELDAETSYLAGQFGWIMIALSLPALLYAGEPFFRSALTGLRSRRITVDVPVVIGMIAIFLRSVYEIVSTTGAGYLDSLTGLIFFLLIGRWFQTFTFSRLRFDRNYTDYFPLAAQLIQSDGSHAPVAAEDLQPGDQVLVRPGELIAADGVLLERPVAGIDYSFVTGEADPKFLKEGTEVYAGGRALASPLRIAISRPVDRSYLLGLWQRSAVEKSTVRLEPPRRLVAWFTAVVSLIALGTFIYWYGYDTATAYRAATAVLIIACSCALALAGPFVFGTLQRLLAQRGYYFRSPEAVQRLAEINHFVFDKTGTLLGSARGAQQLEVLSQDATHHLEVFVGMAAQSNHPVSQLLLEAAKEEGWSTHPIGPVHEEIGQGLIVHTLAGEYRLGSASFCRAQDTGARLYASFNGQLIMRLHLTGRSPRKGIRQLLERLRAHYPIYLLSGDVERECPVWADAIAHENRHFSASPFEKQAFVEKLSQPDGRVLMVGDGLNDTGALSAAHLGLAVSEGDTRFSPACDGIVQADQLQQLDRMARIAKRGATVFKLCLWLALAYNLVGLSYAVSGHLSPVIAAILMPLSSISVVLLASLGAYVVTKN